MYRQAAIHGDDAAALFHLRFSTDYGASWGDVDTFIDSTSCVGAPFGVHGANVDVTDGILMRAPNGDLLVQIHEANGQGTYQYRSTDDGKTWTDEGQIGGAAALTLIGGQDYEIVGSTIYIPVMVDANSDEAHPYLLALYKSADNGLTWTKQGDIDAANDSSEPGIVWTGGDNMLCVSRDASSAQTWKHTSTDLGATWSARASVPDLYILQRPRFRRINDGIVLFGRNQLGDLLNDRTVLYHTSDGGVTWARTFFPDPDTAGYVDTGYCDVLEMPSGQYYMVDYAGDTSAASIVEHIFALK